MTRLLPALAGVLAGVLALTGCTGGGSSDSAPPPSSSTGSQATGSATPSPRPARATPPPSPGARACYRLSYAEAVAPTTDARGVPCGRTHTAMTFSVGRLAAVVDGHLLAVDSRRVQQQVATTCPRRLASYVGGTADDLRLSMLRSVWFTPTVQQSDAGQEWFRCDVIAVAADGRLAPLSPRMAGVLGTSEGRDRFGMCGTAEPGAADFARVVCSRSHSWRAVRVVHLGGGSYPGASAVRDAGQTPCQDAGRAAASNALDFRWGYQWPTHEQWTGGQHFGLCWVPD